MRRAMLVAVCLLMCVSGVSVAGVETLGVALRVKDGKVYVKNTESGPLWGVKIIINDGLFRSGYFSEVELFPSKKFIAIGLMEFANSKGVRFNPFQMKIQVIRIHAQRSDNTRDFKSFVF